MRPEDVFAWQRRLDSVIAASNLPVGQVAEEVEQGLYDRHRLVVSASPGTGKTALLPLIAARHLARSLTSEPATTNSVSEVTASLSGGNSGRGRNRIGRVLVAQPRRVAVRAAARYARTRLAVRGDRFDLNYETKVGWSMRGDSQVGPQTLIEFTTNGALLRRILQDPDLAGVDVLILDEVHERHLDCDLGLAFGLDIADLREDLHLIAMSATADTQPLVDLFGAERTRIVNATANTYPLRVDYRPVGSASLDEYGFTQAGRIHVAQVSARAFREHGSTLVFVPAKRDVEDLVGRLRAFDLPAVPLHGSLSGAEQDRALAGQRRIIVSTDIAQTSLTVEGVRCVVDSCLSRRPYFDAAREVSALVTVRASRADMVQRAGRANRLGAGVVYRCIREADWAQAEVFTPPHSASADLTEALLLAHAWSSVEELRLPSPLPERARESAERALLSIGALRFSRASAGVAGQVGRDMTAVEITEAGRLLARIPADPRLAHALLLGWFYSGGREEVAQTVALLADGTQFRDPDLPRHLAAAPDREVQRLKQWAHRYANGYVQAFAALRGADFPLIVEGGGESVAAPYLVGLVCALAFPARVGHCCTAGSRKWISVASGQLTLPPQRGEEASVLEGDPWIAAGVIQRLGRQVLIRAAAPIRSEWVEAVAAAYREEQMQLDLVGGAVKGRRSVRFGAISLSTRGVDAAQIRWDERLDLELARLVAADLQHEGWGALGATSAEMSMLERLRFWAARRSLPVSLEAVDNAPLIAEMVAPTLKAGASLKDVPLTGVLISLLGWQIIDEVKRVLPTHLVLPSGRSVPLEYRVDGHVYLRAKLQECFGWESPPRVLDEPVILELLSPAGRELAITGDLTSFFRDVYPQVRADMRGRYPKHPWPEDPWRTPATAKTNAALRAEGQRDR